MSGIHTVVSPEGSLEMLSQKEITQLCDPGAQGLNELFRRCCLAVMNTGSEVDDTREALARYPDFTVRVIQRERGVQLELAGAPAAAFVDGRMIRGIREHLFAVLRDVLFIHQHLPASPHPLAGAELTDVVFGILRNAGALQSAHQSRVVVCWGGHAISREEYDYSKLVGYELGLRALSVCTGCGPGAMKGPMKGATIGHAKQRYWRGRYIGITEPGIIAAESPNPIVNELIIMPDIEKRLEAFVRLSHGFVVFPGGVGTAEEILYLLAILLNAENTSLPFPLVLTGPAGSENYFTVLLDFIEHALGVGARERLRVIINQPAEVARLISRGVDEVLTYRNQRDEAFYFNWHLRISEDLQHPFAPTHENMAALQLHRDQPPNILAAQLRRAFSGIVAGNVKEEGLRAVEAHGAFKLSGERGMMDRLDALLRAFVAQGRMKLPGKAYLPCYELQ